MTAIVVVLVALIAGGLGCASPVPEKKPAGQEAKHQYQELKPEVYPLPEGLKAALPGLQNDKLYIYREISPLIALVAYVPDYKRGGAIEMAARAFAALAEKPEFRQGIEFWVVQVQPDLVKEQEQWSKDGKTDAPPSRIVVWGVRPEEFDQYQESKDLAAFVRDSEYLLVDDKIIAKGPDRLKLFPELAKQAIAPEPETPDLEPPGEIIPEQAVPEAPPEEDIIETPEPTSPEPPEETAPAEEESAPSEDESLTPDELEELTPEPEPGDTAEPLSEESPDESE